MEKGFVFPTLGYRQFLRAPAQSALDAIEEGAVEVALRPSAQHVWSGSAWQLASPSLADMKSAKLQALAQQRREARDGGITVGGVPIPTDKETRDTLTAARLLIQIDPSYSISDWKVQDGVFTTLSTAQIVSIAEAVAAHVQACFTREKVLTDAIAAAADVTALDAVDITAGWPS